MPLVLVLVLFLSLCSAAITHLHCRRAGRAIYLSKEFQPTTVDFHPGCGVCVHMAGMVWCTHVVNTPQVLLSCARMAACHVADRQSDQQSQLVVLTCVPREMGGGLCHFSVNECAACACLERAGWAIAVYLCCPRIGLSQTTLGAFGR